ncbi:MAG: hypothetical protein SO459_01945 [Pseudoflavonifractor capillosus]|nr:hypothetical protein [Pseudoflavonifractor capillosus]
MRKVKSQNKNPPVKQQGALEITERNEMITNWLQTVSYTLFASTSILFCLQRGWKGEIFPLEEAWIGTKA